MAKQKRQAVNKAAFDQIVGDPYSLEEIDGHYMTLKSRSSISIAEPENTSRSPVNQARPNHIDFICDVEAAVEDGLRTYASTNNEMILNDLKQLFDNTYYLGSGDIFSQKERAKLEQIVGNILVQRGIYPASKYFTTIKK